MASTNLVFITYTDKNGARDHDLQTRHAVRKQAFHYPRIKSAHGPNIGRKRTPKQASVSNKHGNGQLETQEELVAACSDVINDLSVALVLSERPSFVSRLGNDGWEALNFCKLPKVTAVYKEAMLNDDNTESDLHSQQRASIAINPEDDYIAFTMSDPISLLAHMYLIATDMKNDGHLRGSYLATKFKVATLKAVNEGLRDLREVPSDHLTYAVAALGTVESISGSKDVANAHYKGLLQMIALRGGMSVFAEKKWMIRTIFWSRRCHCLRWHDILGLPEMPADTRPSYDPQVGENNHDIALSQNMSHPRLLQYGGVISRELTDVAADFKTISNSPTKTPAQRKRVSDAIYEVEYKLLLLAQRHLTGLPGLTGLSVTLSKAYHIAAQLYVMLVLRQVPASLPIVKKFSTALAAELESSNSRRFILKRDRLCLSLQLLLFWIQALLALGTTDSVAHHKSLVLLLPSVKSLKLQDFHGFRQALFDVAWLQGHWEDELLRVWSEVIALRPDDTANRPLLIQRFLES